MGGDRVGHRTEQRGADRTVPAGADHDEVSLLGAGHQLVSSDALHENLLDVDPTPRPCLANRVFQHECSVDSYEVASAGRGVLGHVRVRPDVDDSEGRVPGMGLVRCPQQSSGSGRGPVDADDHPPNGH